MTEQLATTSCGEEIAVFINSLLDQQTSTENISIDLTEEKGCKEPAKNKQFDCVQPLLKKCNEKINKNLCNKFNIFREEIFSCCVRAINRKTFNPCNKISVKFSDAVGTSEGAVDEAGPTREMFRLVLNYIKDSEMFCGTDKK